MRRRHLLALLPTLPLAAAAGPLSTQMAYAETNPGQGDDLDLRVMAWNIWSGTLAGARPAVPADVGLENRTQLIEFLRERDPDVLFMVETYGAGEVILAGLNEGRPSHHHYTGVQITEGRSDPSEHQDNLWLFTKLKVVDRFPTINETITSSFNFGGVRAALPNGETICLFTTWLWHIGGAWPLTDNSVWDLTHGLPRRHTDAETIATDHVRRLEIATTILEQRIPSFVRPGERIIMGGDFNTLSHLDWSAKFADAPGHGGLALDWPVMRRYADAGFTDLFRAVHPDAGKYPGTTWSPYEGTGVSPGRIDYLLTRGSGFTPLAARSDMRRLDDHEDFSQMARFPFYSDHGAVTADVRLTGVGRRPWGPLLPLPTETPWTPPAEPLGRRIPAAEITASATSELAGYSADLALDGDPTTMWHSDNTPEAALPHTLRLDLGRVRTVTALRYVPPQRFAGMITQYEIRTSSDGTNFQTVAQGEFGITGLPSVVPLRGRARHVELVARHGWDGFASAVDVQVYEL